MPADGSRPDTPRESRDDPVARLVRAGLPGPLASTLTFFRRGEKQPPAPAPGLSAGKVVGDFRLVSLLGQGGMGQVWEAEQLSLRRRVAVKFVRPERVTEQQLRLFAREARAGGRLSHPGIVAVHGHGTSDGLAWIALEFVDGAWTLKDFLDQAVRAEDVSGDHDAHVARLVAEIAEAMQVAHEAGVIHRDLKPQNVLIAADDQPKVTDFGLARITDESALSESGEVAGTCLYMSPEQVSAKRVDQRSDVFSLGIVLFELLTLRRPFQGDTVHQIAAQILAKDPPDPRTIRSRVPRDLAVIVGKALEKAPEKRYPSMRALAQDLRRHLAHEPIQARPSTRLERLVKWCRRNPGKSSAAAIAGTTFTAIALLLAANVRTNRALGRSNQALQAKTAESEERRVAAELSAEREKAAAELAQENARLATERADDVLSLSALQELEDLEAEAERLWPPVPALLDGYEGWLQRAGELLEERPRHEAKLAELRSSVSLSSSAQDRWWTNQLEKLVSGLAGFADAQTGLYSEGNSPEHGWGIQRRIAFAVSIEELSTTGPEASARWSEALASIADPRECPQYRALRLAPQLGLLPIGRDPASGLWEFAHLQTGEPAERGADGELLLGEGTGLVLVLLPGGTFWMGAQAADPQGRNHDPQVRDGEGPVHAVTLSAFFLSKYEMTQGQWSRFVGSNPSYYARTTARTRITPRHPVEQVSWLDCQRELGRLGLELPSEAQWEYACRAGTGTVWSPGDTLDGLVGFANIADEGARDVWFGGWFFEPGFFDGWDVHCPVGTLLPNAFGLHEMHGNVLEWCADGFDAGFYSSGPAEDPLSPPAGTADRVYRGGSFYYAALHARSAGRYGYPPSFADGNLGVRPARRIDRD